MNEHLKDTTFARETNYIQLQVHVTDKGFFYVQDSVNVQSGWRFIEFALALEIYIKVKQVAWYKLPYHKHSLL